MMNTNTTIGIIAEYNPLHNGHSYMMQTVKSKFPGAVCVVVLGSNFTQRGTPALIDKWTRAKMALNCGADLVLELPFLFACAAAPDFSAGAVDLLARTHLATHIAFGMEDPKRDLTSMLNILLHEPLSFKQTIKKELDRGASYPKAAAIALTHELGLGARASGESNADSAPGAETGSFLTSPNDLLALSYMLRVKSRGYNLTPLPVARVGSSHHDLDINNDCARDKNFFASAGAIREALNKNFSDIFDSHAPVTLIKNMPNFSHDLLLAARDEGRLCLHAHADAKLWLLLQALFLRSTPDDLKKIDGIDEGLENLFLKHWRDAKNFNDFIGRCVSARNTAGRLRRRVMRLLLNVDRTAARATIQAGIPWARVLGFNTRGRMLLRERAKISELPIITRLADAAPYKFKNIINAASAACETGSFTAMIEFRASALYEMLLPQSSNNSPDKTHMHREERMRPILFEQ